MNDALSVKRGFSNKEDALQALAEIKQQIDQENISVVILFCPAGMNLEKLGPALKEGFEAPVLACTTAGEISQKGYSGIAACKAGCPSPLSSATSGISAVSIASPELQVVPHLLDDVQHFDIQTVQSIHEDTEQRLQQLRQQQPDTRAFGLLLIDGLSLAEEGVIASLYTGLTNIPFVGGSAGDALQFEQTRVYYDGRFRSNCAVFAVFITNHPFSVFKIQHFVAGADKLVISAAIPEKRIVTEINGLPAAEEYARFVGLPTDQLDPHIFSNYPVMLRIGGEYYVRAIQKVNEDNSLTFYCAIDEGLVLTIAHGVDMVDNLRESMHSIKKEIPEPRLIIGFECILRRLESAEKGYDTEMAQLMIENNVIGFHTFGEQYNAVHVNQTLTGVAIG